MNEPLEPPVVVTPFPEPDDGAPPGPASELPGLVAPAVRRSAILSESRVEIEVDDSTGQPRLRIVGGAPAPE